MRALMLVVLTLALSACLPVAEHARDLLDSSDGATLSYVAQGLTFDPDGRVALDVQLVATGQHLTLLTVPPGATCEVIHNSTRLDCDLGDVEAPVTVNLTGLRVIADASYRRVGESVPRYVPVR